MTRPEGDLVLIQGGVFLMGDESPGDHAPAHEVFIDAFYIDRCEVTNARYARICRESGHRWPFFWEMAGFRCGPAYPDHPVVGLSWRDALAYAELCGMRLALRRLLQPGLLPQRPAAQLAGFRRGFPLRQRPDIIARSLMGVWV